MKPILVTGAHRSGTTWVGKMLALSPRVGYINEPFSPFCRRGICNLKFERWFTHLSDANADGYTEALAKTMAFRYDVAAEIHDLGINSPPTVGYSEEELHLLEDYNRTVQYHIKRAVPLLKDPIAIFSAEWLSQKFDMNVVVLIRHPAAFAASIKRLNWNIPFGNLADQKLLMEDLLSTYAEKISAYARKAPNIIEQCGLFWNCVYHTVGIYQERHPDWIFVRHEDIARDARGYFEKIYGILGLEWNPEIAAKVEFHSRAENPTEWKDGENPHKITMDSRSVVQNWKSKLSGDEIERLRRMTEDIASRYYSEQDW